MSSPRPSYHTFFSADVLDNDMSPLEFMRKQFPPSVVKMSEESWRSFLSWFGFTKQLQTAPIGMLSDGQKSRLVFAMLAQRKNGVLLLDEVRRNDDGGRIRSSSRNTTKRNGGPGACCCGCSTSRPTTSTSTPSTASRARSASSAAAWCSCRTTTVTL